jgi:hypothetical protein
MLASADGLSLRTTACNLAGWPELAGPRTRLYGAFMGDVILALICLLLLAALAIAAVRLAWWAFRMVFWIIIIFIGEAGRAWRGER